MVIIDRLEIANRAVGEHLSPDGVVALNSLGVGALIESPDHAPCPLIESAWGEQSIVRRDYITSAHGPGVNLDRRRFGADLRAVVVACGARLLVGCQPGKALREDTGWTVTLGGDARNMLVRARFIVDATGRAAWLGRRFGSKILQCDQLVAIVVFLKSGDGVKDDNGRLLIESTSAGWWYSVNLPSGATIATLMTEANLVREGGALPDWSWRNHLTSAPFTAVRCAGLAPSSPIRVANANTQYLALPVGDDWLAVGDAAQAYDPLSSAGISKGLTHGILAANTVAMHLLGDRKALQYYADQMAREFTEYLETRHAYYAIEQRWPDAPFWRSRHSCTS